MPDLGQVRTACYRVMRMQGLIGVTIGAVADMMRKNGVKPGSDRDLSVMVRAWRREQETLTELPPHVVEIAQKLAKTVWEIALSTAFEMEIQRGGADEDAARSRTRKPPPKGRARLALLQKGIEALLRKDAEEAFLRAPTARDIFRTLPEKLAALTDEKHIDRDLLEIAKRSGTVIRLANGKWWRRDRPLPPDHVQKGRIAQGYERTGTALSRQRTANEKLMNNAVSVLLEAKRGMERTEIAAALDIPPEGRKRFYQMLRNHLRAEDENARFQYEDGKYVIIAKVGRTKS